MIETYTFAGDAITFLGMIGITSTMAVLITAFRFRAKVDAAPSQKQIDDSFNYDTNGK